MARSFSGVFSSLFRTPNRNRTVANQARAAAADRPAGAGPVVVAAARAAVEALESRTLLAVTTLTNGTGDASLSIIVDAYGAYGSAANPAGEATYDPVGPGGPNGSTFESGVYFSGVNDFLSEGELSGTGGQPAVNFTSTSATEAVSTFTAGGFNFTLTQSLLGPQNEGSTLRQVYRFTNNTGVAQSVRFVRHVDGDLDFRPGLDDFAGVTADGRFVFEFDTATDPEESVGFFGITNQGGTQSGFTIQPYGGGYFNDIVAANGIPAADLNRINRDADNNRLTDVGYDVTVTQQNDISIAAGATAEFITITQFGQGAPAEVVGIPVIQFSAPTYTVFENRGVATITVVRSGGRASSATVDFATVPGGTATPGADYQQVSGRITFAPGQTRATFDVPIVADNISDVDETVQLALTNPGEGARLGTPNVATLTIEDPTSFVFLLDTGIFVQERIDEVAEITLFRSGATDLSATVQVTTTDQTATAGPDYTAVSTEVTFRPGDTTATVEVPILFDFFREPAETFTVTVTSVGGNVVVVEPANLTVTILDLEPPPIITDVRTVGVANLITEIVLTFNIELDERTAEEPTNYDIFARRERRLGGSPARNRIPLGDIVYDPAALTVTIETRKPMRTNRFYELNVSGTRTNAIATPSGGRLDGNLDGLGGDDYRAYFARGNAITYFDTQGDRVHLRMENGGVMDILRPVLRDEVLLRFDDFNPGGSTLTGQFSPNPRLSDHLTVVSLFDPGGLLRELPPQIIVDDTPDNIIGPG